MWIVSIFLVCFYIIRITLHTLHTKKVLKNHFVLVFYSCVFLLLTYFLMDSFLKIFLLLETKMINKNKQTSKVRIYNYKARPVNEK